MSDPNVNAAASQFEEQERAAHYAAERAFFEAAANYFNNIKYAHKTDLAKLHDAMEEAFHNMLEA